MRPEREPPIYEDVRARYLVRGVTYDDCFLLHVCEDKELKHDSVGKVKLLD